MVASTTPATATATATPPTPRRPYNYNDAFVYAGSFSLPDDPSITVYGDVVFLQSFKTLKVCENSAKTGHSRIQPGDHYDIVEFSSRPDDRNRVLIYNMASKSLWSHVLFKCSNAGCGELHDFECREGTPAASE